MSVKSLSVYRFCLLLFQFFLAVYLLKKPVIFPTEFPTVWTLMIAFLWSHLIVFFSPCLSCKLVGRFRGFDEIQVWFGGKKT